MSAYENAAGFAIPQTEIKAQASRLEAKLYNDHDAPEGCLRAFKILIKICYRQGWGQAKYRWLAKALGVPYSTCCRWVSYLVGKYIWKQRTGRGNYWSLFDPNERSDYSRVSDHQNSSNTHSLDTNTAAVITATSLVEESEPEAAAEPDLAVKISSELRCAGYPTGLGPLKKALQGLPPEHVWHTLWRFLRKRSRNTVGLFFHMLSDQPALLPPPPPPTPEVHYDCYECHDTGYAVLSEITGLNNRWDDDSPCWACGRKEPNP